MRIEDTNKQIFSLLMFRADIVFIEPLFRGCFFFQRTIGLYCVTRASFFRYAYRV
jgi:hypothetical protein